jgi:glycosyltransferase involved in cell wall biosynthesis
MMSTLFQKTWKSDETLVDIICATFQHEDFIEDALNGFLAQKTDFRFRIIVRDDCSSDSTVDILRRYELKYPSIIKGIYEPFNKWPAVKLGVVLRNASKSKYLAECEGDDYWIDEYKLQKQFDYLESHDDVVLLKTRTVWIEGGKVIEPSVEGGTRTHMSRNNLMIPINYRRFIFFGDTYYQAMLNKYGKTALLDEVTAVWRKHSGGVFSSLLDSDNRVLNMHRSQTQAWIAQQFYDDGDDALANRHMASSIRLFFKTMKLKDTLLVLSLLLYSSTRRIVGSALRVLHLR